MNNIESMSLESIINGAGLGSYSTGPGMVLTSAASSMVMANGSLGMGSSLGSLSSGAMLSSSSTPDSLMSSSLDELSSTSFAHHLSGATNGGHSTAHLNHNTAANHHGDMHILTTTSSNHFINSTSTGPISTTTSGSGGFSLDQFDTIDAVAGCQLLHSYNIIKDEDYGGLLDDEDVLGSLMMSSSGLHQDHISGHSISEHLTPAQFNLLEDCLDHITSSDSALVSSMSSMAPTSSTSITTIPTSSTLNQLNSTLNSSVLTSHNHTASSHQHLNHVQHHEPTLNNQNHLGSHHHHTGQQLSDHSNTHDPYSSHHQYETINFADCADLADDLSEHLNAVTTSSAGQISSNGIVVQAANLSGIVSSDGEDLLTPILTTVTSSSAGVVATTTTNVGQLGQNVVTDQLLLLKEEDSNASGASLNAQVSTPTKSGKGKVKESSKTNTTNSRNISNQNSNASTNSSMMSPSPANQSGSSNSSVGGTQDQPLSPSTGNGLKEEICRLTVCPLCDNAKSFCSSSSVTRHLRSVHKLNDLLGTRNCYCLLCARFLEDLPEFFAHLKSDHQLLQQPDPVNSLYVRHLFKSFDDFMRWKNTELEKQTGCKYERCFTNEYPRSIYFKCSAIRITRITLAGKCSTSCKEPPALEPGSKGSPNGGTSSGSEAGGEKSSSSNNPNEVVLESSFDARMYPCTSSIRLIFRYTGIEAIEFPYHLGHKLESNMRDLCLSHVHTAPNTNSTLTAPQHVVHLNATSTTTATITPAMPSNNGTTNQHHQTHHIQIKSEVIPAGMTPSGTTQLPPTTTSVVNGPKTTTTNHQIVFIPSKTPTTVAKAVAIATTPGNITNDNNEKSVINTPATPATIPQAKSKSRKRNRESKSSAPKGKIIKLEPHSSELGGKIAQLSSAKLIVNPSVAGQVNSASSTFMTSAPFSSATATSSAILTTINANNTFTLTPIKSNGMSLTATPITLNQQLQPLTINTGPPVQQSLTPSNTLLLKSPATNPLDTSLLIDNLASDIFLDASYDDPGDSKTELKLDPHHQSQVDATMTTLVIKQYHEDPHSAALGLGLSTIKAEDLEDSKDSLILPPAATTTVANQTAPPDDGLGIVPLEKAMQMVQESIRPRKEQLRKRFNELLEQCLTESDIEVVESTVEQLISTNLLQ